MAINLLPWREQAKARSRKLFLIMIIIYLCIMINLALFCIIFFENILREQAKIIHALQQSTDDLNFKYQKILALEKLKNKQIEEVNFILRQRNRQEKFLQLLYQIGDVMPPRTYLTKIDKQKNQVILSGKSESHAKIAIFLKNLENKKIEGHPHLQETTIDEKDNGVNFVILVTFDAPE